MRLLDRSGIALCVLAVAALCHAPIARAAHWLPGSWSHRAKLTADPAQLAGTFTGFSLVLSLDDSRLSPVFTHGKPDGSDLVLTGPDGTTVVPHELVSFDPLAGAGEVWFRAATLSPSTNEFYLYFGHEDTTVVTTPGSVWAQDDLAVHHFSENPANGVLADSGPRSNHAQIGLGSTWSSSDLVAGRIGNGWSFDDVNHWLYCDTMTSSESSFTISAWFANADLAGGGATAFHSLSGYWSLSFQRTEGQAFASIQTANGFMTWEPEIADNEFHHYVWTLDAAADTARFYLDGVERDVDIHFRHDPMTPVYVGENITDRVGIAGPVFYNSLDLIHGVVDEMRVREGVRPSGWVLAEYANQSDPETFFDVVVELRTDHPTGVDAVSGPRVARINAWPNPMSSAAEISLEAGGGASRIAVYDVAGRLVRTLVPDSEEYGLLRMRWDGRDERGLAAASGTYYLRLVGDREGTGAKVLLLR